MAVLVEGISVVVRRPRIAECYPRGWDEFLADVPNRTLCADPDLARVGFMTPADAKGFVALLGRRGLEFLRDGRALDLCVVDQLKGPTVPCAWLDCGTGVVDGHTLAACQVKGSQGRILSCPDGWSFAGSLSASPAFVPFGQASERLVRLAVDDTGVEAYLDLGTGRERYIGRMDPSADLEAQ